MNSNYNDNYNLDNGATETASEKEPKGVKSVFSNLKSLVPYLSESEKKNFAQYFIGVDDIRAGLIFMSNGSVVKILEVLPINFDEKPKEERERAVVNFASGLKQGPRSAHIKIMRTKANLQNWQQNVLNMTEDESP